MLFFNKVSCPARWIDLVAFYTGSGLVMIYEDDCWFVSCRKTYWPLPWLLASKSSATYQVTAMPQMTLPLLRSVSHQYPNPHFVSLKKFLATDFKDKFKSYHVCSYRLHLDLVVLIVWLDRSVYLPLTDHSCVTRPPLLWVFYVLRSSWTEYLRVPRISNQWQCFLLEVCFPGQSIATLRWLTIKWGRPFFGNTSRMEKCSKSTQSSGALILLPQLGARLFHDHDGTRAAFMLYLPLRWVPDLPSVLLANAS